MLRSWTRAAGIMLLAGVSLHAQHGTMLWRTVIPMPEEVEVYLASDGVAPPTLIGDEELPYPAETAGDGREPLVIATIVGSDGVPRESMVLHGLVRRFDEAAMDLVNRLRFQPGKLNGKPVAVEMGIEIPAPEGGNTHFVPRIFPLKVAVVPPLIRSMIKARYPKSARKTGLRGTVEVGLIVDHNGEISDLHVKKSLTPDTDESAIAAVREYRFKPASVDGKPFATPMTIEVPFAPE